jgi:hypothetical protein
MQLRHTFDYLKECAGEMTKNSTLQGNTRAATMHAAFPWVRYAVPLLQIHVCLNVLTRISPRGEKCGFRVLPVRDSEAAPAFGQPTGKMLVCQWFADMKALGRIAAQTVQHIPGHTALNTLCHYLVTKIMSQVDN